MTDKTLMSLAVLCLYFIHAMNEAFLVIQNFKKDWRKIICLGKSEVSVERTLVHNVIKNSQSMAMSVMLLYK